MMSKLVPELRFDGFGGEWEEKSLFEISDFINDKIQLEKIGLDNYISTENLLPNFKGATKATKLPNINNVTYFKKNDILLSNIRPYLKKVWFSSMDGGASNDVIVIRAKEDVKSKFLLNIIQNDKFIDYVMLGAKGVKMPRGDISLIKKYPIFIPKPPEQQKIANCLSSLDNLIESQNKKVEALKKHKKGLMQGLFPAEGENEPKLRFEGFGGEWEEVELGEVITYQNGKAHEQDIREIGKYIVVNSKFISTDGEVKKYTDTAFCIAKKGEVLMVLSDVPNGRAIAKCFLVEIDDLYTVNQRICKISSNQIISIFLFYILNRNPYFLDFDDGVKQTNLRKDDVLSCPILLPKDNLEQQKIANCLNSLDNLIEAQNKKVEALKKHKKGLMQGLFVSSEVGV